jgi:protein phosphatase
VTVRLRWGSATDVGRVRSNNQDSRITTERVLAVADGMGGHRGGEVASQIALETLPLSFTEPSLEGLEEAALVANEAVWQRAAGDPELRGMGTTLVAIAPVVDDNGHETIAWVNIGDSRLYLLRDGDLEQVSQDHSLVEEMVRDGRISPDEARDHPQRNILTRALGIDPRASVDAGSIDPYSGDRFLLCSDGLFNEVDEPRIAATLRRLDDPDEAAKELVRLALENGGRDNITVVLGDVVDDGGVSQAASETITTGTAEGHADLAGFATATQTIDAEPEMLMSTDASPSEPKRRRRDRAKRSRPRLLTFRVVLFVLVLLAVIGGAAFAVVRSARSGYTVKRVADQVVIYEGNGDRVLWVDPAVQENVGNITIAPRDLDAVTAGRHFSSLDEAHGYIDTLRRDASEVGPAVTTTTSTTTTIVPTTTAPVATAN